METIDHAKEIQRDKKMCIKCKYESYCPDAYTDQSQYCGANKSEADNILAAYFGNPYPVKHVVLIMWRSPITSNLEHRSAAFEEHAEAEEFARHMLSQYDKTDMAHVVYLNGVQFKERQ